MKVKHHHLTDNQIKFVARLANKEKVSKSEIVRRALDNYETHLGYQLRRLISNRQKARRKL